MSQPLYEIHSSLVRSILMIFFMMLVTYSIRGPLIQHEGELKNKNFLYSTGYLLLEPGVNLALDRNGGRLPAERVVERIYEFTSVSIDREEIFLLPREELDFFENRSAFLTSIPLDGSAIDCMVVLISVAEDRSSTLTVPSRNDFYVIPLSSCPIWGYLPPLLRFSDRAEESTVWLPVVEPNEEGKICEEELGAKCRTLDQFSANIPAAIIERFNSYFSRLSNGDRYAPRSGTLFWSVFFSAIDRNFIEEGGFLGISIFEFAELGGVSFFVEPLMEEYRDIIEEMAAPETFSVFDIDLALSILPYLISGVVLWSSLKMLYFTQVLETVRYIDASVGFLFTCKGVLLKVFGLMLLVAVPLVVAFLAAVLQDLVRGSFVGGFFFNPMGSDGAETIFGSVVLTSPISLHWFGKNLVLLSLSISFLATLLSSYRLFKLRGRWSRGRYARP